MNAILKTAFVAAFGMFVLTEHTAGQLAVDPRCTRMADKIGCTCAVQNGGDVDVSRNRWFSKRGGNGVAANEAFVQCSIRYKGKGR